ncbi:MAG: hypothetical protein ABWY78_00840 [Microvirga sp.]|jgi:hypothetical protein
MRVAIILAASGILGTVLSGCQFGGSSGVFEHSTVPPPPSLSSEVKTSATQDSKPVGPAPRRSQSERAVQPAAAAAPAEPAIAPVMTGSGMGAGFRF